MSNSLEETTCETEAGVHASIAAASTSLTGIEPGDYKLLSWDIADEDEEPWLEADWLKPFEVSGTSIHLGESDTKTLQLNLIDLPKDANAQ